MAKGTLTLTGPASTLLVRMMSELQKIRSTALRYTTEKFSRIEPYWFYLHGPPGTGKSQLVPFLAQSLLKVLEPRAQELDLPKEGERIYAVNFTDRYETSYRQQYITTVDDVFQDRPGVLETSSALKLINWVSNVPHHTNQAALADKGIFFESRILITTSNVEHPDRTMELNDNEALLRRMRCKLAIDYRPPHDHSPQDPYLQDGVRAVYEGNPILISDFVKLAAIQFTQFYRRQKALLANRTVSDEDLEGLKVGFMEATAAKKSSQPLGMFAFLCQLVLTWLLYMCMIYPSASFGVAKSVYRKGKRRLARLYEAAYATAEDWISFPYDIDRIRNDPLYARRYFVDTGLLEVEGCSLNHRKEHRGQRIAIWKELRPAQKLNANNVLVPDDDIILNNKALTADEMTELIDLKKRTMKEWNEQQSRERTTAFDAYIDFVGTDPLEKTTMPLDRLKALWNHHIQYLKSYWEKLYLTTLGKILLALTAMATLYGAKKLWDAWNASTMDSTAVKYDSGKVKPQKQAKASTRFVPSAELSTELFDYTGTKFDESAFDLISSLSSRSAIAVLETQSKDGPPLIANCIRIKDTAILANHHSFAAMKDGDKFVVKVKHTGTKTIPQLFSSKRMVRIPNKDAVVYNMTKDAIPARNIIKHFQPDHIQLRPTPAVMMTVFPNHITHVNLTAEPLTQVHSYEQDGVTYKTDTASGYLAKLELHKGNSGSPLIAFNTQNPRKILGIQVAGDLKAKIAMYHLITETELVTACDHLMVDEPIEIPLELTLKTTGCVFREPPPNLGKDSLIYVGSLSGKHRMTPASNTKIVPSIIHDPTTSKFAPAVLKSSDPRLDPDLRNKINLVYKQAEGFDRPIGVFDTEIMDEVVEELKIEYSSKLTVPTIPRRLLTDEEVVNGLPGVYKALDLDTSPGYPYVIERKKPHLKGKREWFDAVETKPDGHVTYAMNEDLYLDFAHQDAMIRQGKRPLNVAYMCLKDEKRSKEKISIGKTRAFICLDMVYNMLIRKYFGLFIATQQALVGRHPNCVGLNPVEQFTTLALQLLQRDDRINGFDFKQYDSSLLTTIFFNYADIVSAWYGDSRGDVGWIARRVLMSTLAYSFVIIDGHLFVMTNGNLSGVSITANINSDGQDQTNFYCYKKACFENLRQAKDEETRLCMETLMALHVYRHNVALWLYGDDHLSSIRRECHKFYNPDKIRSIYAELGMNMTAADKTDDLTPKPLSEVTFLKRSFRQDESGRYLCPLDVDVLEEIPQWIHKCDDPVEATRVNCEMALQEAYMYGKTYFNTLRENLNRRLKEATKDLLTPVSLTLSYEYFEDKHRSGKLEIIGAPSSFV